MTKIIDLEEKRQEFKLRRATVDMMDAFKRAAQRAKETLEAEDLVAEEVAEGEGAAAEAAEEKEPGEGSEEP